MKKSKNKFVFICITVILLLSINLTSCSGINKINFEQTSEREINLDFDRLNTRKTYNLFIEKQDIILVDMIKDGGILNLHVYDQNNREIYRGNGNLVNKFVISVPEEGLYIFEVEGNNAKGSFKVEIR